MFLKCSPLRTFIRAMAVSSNLFSLSLLRFLFAAHYYSTIPDNFGFGRVVIGASGATAGSLRGYALMLSLLLLLAASGVLGIANMSVDICQSNLFGLQLSINEI